jgi:nickel-dependent lactate racemase
VLYTAFSDQRKALSPETLHGELVGAFGAIGARRSVLAVPPDVSRRHSFAGAVLAEAAGFYGDAVREVLPATGTHFPMTGAEIAEMYGSVPPDLFRAHDWKHDLVELGTVPAEVVRSVSDGALDVPWTAQVNRTITDGGHDMVLSIGQVVPHEVVGMANHAKNILIGTGGPKSIHTSHYLGAVYGMERIMGRADTPVRRVLNYAAERFLRDVPIVYVLTVVAPGPTGEPELRGVFVGDDQECFERAAALSARVNVTEFARPAQRIVAYLEPASYRSTWLGNKAIYRTRMALADGGTLVVIAPGVRTFGESQEMDAMIRRYGYVGTDRVKHLIETTDDLPTNLAAAAHLIHGSTEGRFTVEYCAGGLSREEIEAVGYRAGDVEAAMRRYRPQDRASGWGTDEDGEEFYFVRNPGLGLWSTAERLRG